MLDDTTRLLQTVNYIVYNMDDEQAFIVALVQHFPKEQQETIMTIAERIRNEGIGQGVGQGVDKTILAIELLKQGELDLKEISKKTGIDLPRLNALQSAVKH